MDHLEKILNKNNVKPTAMRLLVLQYLLEVTTAVSLSDIESYFYKSERTTLFRTLKTFVKSNLAHQIDDGTSITKYALCADSCECIVDLDLHVHFHCRQCLQTICLPDHKIPNITLSEGFVSEEINLVVKGVCDQCNRSAK